MGKYKEKINKILKTYPELKKLEEVQPSGLHYTDAYHHTLDALYFVDEILTEIEKLDFNELREDYSIAFKAFRKDYASWLEEALDYRIPLYTIDSTSIDDFVLDNEPMFFDYLEDVGIGKEDAYTPKGVLLVSYLTGHLMNLGEVSQEREVFYSSVPHGIKCKHTILIDVPVDPVLPDPDLTLHVTALHDVGKIIKNTPNGVASCHDKVGFAYAGKLSKRVFSSSAKSNIEVMVLHHHILPRSKSYRKFAERLLDVIRYGHRAHLLSTFYLMRTADLYAHKEEAKKIIEELFVDFMNLPSFAPGEKFVACPLYVISKYTSLSIPTIVKALRRKVLHETFRDGIGNEFLFEIYYVSKVARS